MTESAPAKVILFGEHAVVHGQPAIAVPISSLRATATIHPNVAPGAGLQINAVDLDEVLPVDIDSDLMDSALAVTARHVLKVLEADPPDVTITLESNIPMASGLGSGAAVSTALARAVASAVGKTLDREALNDLIHEIEKLYHGTPSGIDNTVVVYEKPVYFVRGQPIEILLISQPFTLILGDTGHSALTRVVVADVRRLLETETERIRPVLDAIGGIARRARTVIETGEIDSLGPLMNENHELLRQLTVSSDELDQLVNAALNAGAVGAKLSGAGRGGNMIALSPPENAEMVRQALLEAGAVRVFVSTVE